MKMYGYSVNWSDTRKNITFTTPNDKKCRDKTLSEPETVSYTHLDVYKRQSLHPAPLAGV